MKSQKKHLHDWTDEAAKKMRKNWEEKNDRVIYNVVRSDKTNRSETNGNDRRKRHTKFNMSTSQKPQ